jgi:hypothetical protein
MHFLVLLVSSTQCDLHVVGDSVVDLVVIAVEIKSMLTVLHLESEHPGTVGGMVTAEIPRRAGHSSAHSQQIQRPMCKVTL